MRADHWRGRLTGLATAVSSIALAGLLGWAIADLPREPGGLAALVAESLDQAGAAHQVTAVLLDFRAYDTWLEVGVLLLAALAVLALHRLNDAREAISAEEVNPLLRAAARVTLPLMVLVAAFLLWLGTEAPGGAFQAGAVLGAAAIVALLAGWRSTNALPAPLLQLLLAAGFIGFLAVGLGTLAAGRALLDHPSDMAQQLIVLIELTVTLAVGASLALLFAIGGRR